MKNTIPTKKSIEKEVENALEAVLATHKLSSSKLVKELHSFSKRIAKKILKTYKKSNTVVKKKVVKKAAKRARRISKKK